MLHLEYLRESSVSRLHVPQLPKQPYSLHKTKHHLHDKCIIGIIWAYEAWHIHLGWTTRSRCCWMPRCVALQTNSKHSVWQKYGSILKSILWFYTKLKHCYICQITQARLRAFDLILPLVRFCIIFTSFSLSGWALLSNTKYAANVRGQ